nr:ribonuclease H-like domain-containing protein [Tanacetum cinerariifolium]
MVTCFKVRIMKANPNTTYMLPPPHLSSSLLSMPFEILTGNKLFDEYKALNDNNTWVLVSRPPSVNIVRSMWLYKHKYNADGSLNRYKARLAVNGRSEQQGIDCDETFSPVVKPATIRTVLSPVVTQKWPIHQLDVKNAFLHDHLTKTVYMHQPPGFTDSPNSDYLIAYSDANWACCSATRRSTSGYCIFLSDNLLTWSSKRQDTLSRSSAEAEYRGVGNAVAETSWIHNLLRELHTPLFTVTLVYCDNVSAVYMSANPVQHQRTKHIEINIHFVRDKVASGHVRVLHVPLLFQYAYIFTKRLPYSLFTDFRSSLSI